jgi:ATP-dependent Clp protease ATP-binding subunit ClpA
LKRVTQQRIQNPLATQILRGTVAENGQVTIDFRNGNFTFDAAEPNAGRGSSAK